MDPAFLHLYNEELGFLRGMGAEFAEAFPKIAGRLGLQGDEVADPYVERLLEGFAFMAARVQHKLHARFPAFTQHLLEQVYPHFLPPVPSMGIVRFEPDPEAGRLERGYLVPRGTRLFSHLPPGASTHCEFRTAQDVWLWPIAIQDVDYYGEPGQVAALDLPRLPEARAVLRIRLRTTNGLAFDRLAFKALALHCLGLGGTGALLAMHLLSDAIAIVARPSIRPFAWQEVMPAASLRQTGLEAEEALLPPTPRSFDGYRLLQEVFALPERALGLKISGLADAVLRNGEEQMDLLVVLRRAELRLQRQLGPQSLLLFTTPAVNLFERHADHVDVSERRHEHRIVVDRLRGQDLELHSILRVLGIGEDSTEAIEFRPFYNLRDHGRRGGHQSYYTLRRETGLLSQQQRRHGTRTGYVGSETYLALVDQSASAFSGSLRQLAIRALCSNRDLPLLLQPGRGETDFTLEIGAPVAATRFVGLPSRPRASPAQGDVSWKLISHLSLNYLSITGSDQAEGQGGEGQGAEALRELLRLYLDGEDAAAARRIDGIRAIRSRPITRRLPGRGPGAIARGLEIEVTMDEAAFEGVGVFPLGAVLARFFAKYVSINAFTETVLVTLQRGEVMRWPMLAGRREIL